MERQKVTSITAKDLKEVFGSVFIFGPMFGIPLAFAAPWVAQLLYLSVALIWLIPDRRMVRVVNEQRG